VIDALSPIGSIPEEISGVDRLCPRTIVEFIRNDPEWKNRDYQQQPLVDIMT
jgi:homoserine O-acetyltransferase